MALPLQNEGMNRQHNVTRNLLAAAICGLLISCNSGSTVSSTADDPAPTPQTTPGDPPAADPAPEPPVARNACVAHGAASGPLAGRLSDHVTDTDSVALRYELTSDATQGHVEIDLATGQYTYTPTTGQRGQLDYFSYQVTDADGLSDEATLSMVVGERRIMPFGDSITAGVTHFTGITGDQPDEPERVGYRKRLLDRLTAGQFAVDFVGSQHAGTASGIADADHQGHPGFQTSLLADNVSRWLDQNPADVMLIHVGTNDLSRSALPVELLLQEIRNWELLNHTVDVLVATIIDHHADALWADVVEDFNADLRQRLAANWPAVTVVDQYSALDNVVDMSPLSVDSVGLHPNTGGYRKMADTWFDALIASAGVVGCPAGG
ncbi:MAG: SGNH/GDSL hydrolase family protein [Pseudomonadota bacterium]